MRVPKKEKWSTVVLVILLFLPMAVCLSDLNVPEDVLFAPELSVVAPFDGFQDNLLIEQVFEAPEEEILAIAVQFGTYMRENHFSIQAELREFNSETPLATREINASQLVDNAYERIDFGSVQVKQGERYVLALHSHGADAGNTVTVYRGEDGSATEENYACINGEDQSYTLDFRIIGGPSCLYGFLAALILAFFAVLAGTIWALYKCLPREVVFSALALALGLLYMFAITPFSIPDGHFHYFTSYQMSSVILGQRVDGVYYGEAEDFDFTGFTGHYNTAAGYRRVVNEFGKQGEHEELVPIPYDRYDEYFVQEIPSGLGIALARFLGYNLVTTILMGRLFNLIFFASCVYFAVKRTPRYKTAIGLAALVPMSLHQAASCSYDCFIDGISLFLISSILKAIYEEGGLTKRDYLCILLAGVLLAPAKVIYSGAILLLCLLIPWKRFSSKKKKAIGIGMILLCALIFVGIFRLRALGDMVVESDELNWAGGHNYTLGFVLQHPLKTMGIYIRTLDQYGTTWIFCMIGAMLSGLSLGIPQWIILALMVTIFLAIGTQREPLPASHRVYYILTVTLVTVLAMTSMFLGWTSDTWQVIEGVQGRYLLPVFPLLVVSLGDSLTLRKDIDRELIVTTILLHGNVIMAVLEYTLQH